MSSSQISEEVRARVRTEAKNQCGYCRSLQKYVLGVLEIEHIIPKALGGTDDEENLSISIAIPLRIYKPYLLSWRVRLIP